MSAYNLLKREIREYIYDQGWPSLRKIQEASIKQSMTTDNNLIIAAPTASGKTEAAFLPAINSISNSQTGLKIIYVSPLIALINDQFKRMTQLCNYLNIPVTSWHGEAPQANKQSLLSEPRGLLLITPESLEAMFSVRSDKIERLFEATEWIIVDEIHSFLDNNRGLHLKSLLERITKLTKANPRFIGMSATLNKEDYDITKNFFVNDRITNVLLDKSSNRLEKTISYHQENEESQSTKAIQEIFEYSKKESMLVFPNSRSQVENIAVNLSKLSKQEKTYTKFFAHHSAISREMRTTVENFAKTSKKDLFTICCTSTLELGIDIGSVDSVVQYNAPYSVSSLSQRLGRSGRKERKSILHFIGTNPWSLLQGLAAIELYEEKYIDRISPIKKSYDVFAHQILSIVLEKNGLLIEDIYKINQTYKTWNSISNEETKDLINHLIKKNYLEIVENEIITGRETESLLFAGNFFAHFLTEEFMSVYDGNKKIGELPLVSNIEVGSHIALSAKHWEVISINYENQSIQVHRSTIGEAINFLSAGGHVTNELRRKMKTILFDEELESKYEEIASVLVNLSSQLFRKGNYVWADSERENLVTFEGTKINTTLQLMLNMMDINQKYVLNEKESIIGGKNLEANLVNLEKRFDEIPIKNYLETNMQITNTFLANLKYIDLLPDNLKIDYVLNNILDIEGTKEFLRNLNTKVD